MAGLTSLETLDIKRNKMEGPIPPEIGNLSKLEVLDLAGAGFSGPVPSELGNLVNLRRLRLNANSLDGRMPTTMLDISGLIDLLWGGRGSLCVFATKRFLAWLAPIERTSGPVCGGEEAFVLDTLYSATNGQSWTSSRGWFDPGLPIDRHGVTTDTAGRVVSIDLSGNGLVDVPLRELSYNRTGLCVPPDDDAAGFSSWLRTLEVHDDSWLCCKRIPLQGRRSVDVRVAPPLHLTVLPMLQRPQPDSSILDAAAR